MKILIACQCATNKGDRAIAEYLLSQVLKIKDIEIILSTTSPTLWTNLKDQNIKVIGMGYRSICKASQPVILRKITRTIQKYLYDPLLFSSLISPKKKHYLCNIISSKFINFISEVDMVIVTGGHHITSLREKNALFSFTYDIGLISLYSKKYFLWSQTVGPLDFTSIEAKNFFKKVFINANAVYLRNNESIQTIEKLYGCLPNILKTYDSVFGYGSISFENYNDRKRKIGISIFDGLRKAFNTFEIIAHILDHFVNKGYEIEFFRMEYDKAELNSIHKIIKLMKKEARYTIFPFETTTLEHLYEISSCSFFIGYKTHSVVMALTTATPLLAIAYHEKTIDFMRDFGLEKYSVFDENLTEIETMNTVFEIEKSARSIHKQELETSFSLAEEIKQDLENMVIHG